MVSISAGYPGQRNEGPDSKKFNTASLLASKTLPGLGQPIPTALPIILFVLLVWIQIFPETLRKSSHTVTSTVQKLRVKSTLLTMAPDPCSKLAHQPLWAYGFFCPLWPWSCPSGHYPSVLSKVTSSELAQVMTLTLIAATLHLIAPFHSPISFHHPTFFCSLVYFFTICLSH